jgi:LysM repeat protein
MLRTRRTGGFRERAAIAALLGCIGIVALSAPAPAAGSAAHLVQPGESLWSIAAANNLTTRTVAVFNGLSEDALLTAGETIQVPTVDEGAAALANAGITPGSSSSATASSNPGVGHVVQPGESLWSVAAANGITTTTLASFNGLSDEALLITGETIQIPSATTVTSSSTSSGLGVIPSPYGDLNLTPAAADAWNAMREASLAQFGIDLYPGGPLSAYRTYDQQAYLYDLYVSGQGAPANPPGTSTHELGIAVDVADQSMRSVIDQIGAAYGWSATIPTEWWHVAYSG